MTNGWYIRKVKNGSVKISGRLYRPDETHTKYDGRLDSIYYVFVPYRPYLTKEPTAECWGTAAAYYAYSDKLRTQLFHEDPKWVEYKDVWAFWRAV